jgi:hypothetical protein
MTCPCLTYLELHQAMAEPSGVVLGLADSKLAPARFGPLATGCST